jgi:hypothetical protein
VGGGWAEGVELAGEEEAKEGEAQKEDAIEVADTEGRRRCKEGEVRGGRRMKQGLRTPPSQVTR